MPTTANNYRSKKKGKTKGDGDRRGRGVGQGGQRSSGGIKMPGVHSPPLPTLLLLEELTDVLGGHDLSVADSSSHDLHLDRRSL